MVHIYIGNGKGKTTAALGLAFRAVGWGKRVYVAQFLKDIKYPSGELRACSNISGITIERFKDQIHPIFLKSKTLTLTAIKRSVAKSIVCVERYIGKQLFDIIVLDEILDALRAGFISLRQLRLLIKKSAGVELILTGRNAPWELIKIADYVSYVKKIKHPFDKKISARRGVEY